jgi:WD40 repeat protein
MWIQKVPGGGVTALAYSTDGGTLFTHDSGSWVMAWDVAAHTGRRLYRADRWIFHGLRPLADGRLVIHNIPLAVWRPESNAIETLAAPAGFDDGRIPLITPGGRLYGLDPDMRSVGVWDLNTGRIGPRHGPWIGDLFGFDITPDERVIAVINPHGQVAVADLRTGERLGKFRPQFPTGAYSAHTVVVSPDGNTVIAHSGEAMQVWDVPSRSVRLEHVTGLLADEVLAFHPTAPLFVSLNPNRELTLFSLDNGEPVRSLDFALGRKVKCAAFAPDGLTCAVGGSDRQFAVFDVDL